MSVLIKEMKMPQSCGECHFLSYPFNVPVCSVTKEIFTIPYNRSLRQVLQERKTNCPLEEVTGEMRHGRWKNIYSDNYKCSVCGAWYRSDEPIDFVYCPNCGAKMVNEDDDTD